MPASFAGGEHGPGAGKSEGAAFSEGSERAGGRARSRGTEVVSEGKEQARRGEVEEGEGADEDHQGERPRERRHLGRAHQAEEPRSLREIQQKVGPKVMHPGIQDASPDAASLLDGHGDARA